MHDEDDPDFFFQLLKHQRELFGLSIHRHHQVRKYALKIFYKKLCLYLANISTRGDCIHVQVHCGVNKKRNN